MKYITGKHIVFGWLAAALVLLTGCQSDGADTTAPRKVRVEMQAYAKTYSDALPKASTRAEVIWNPNPPSGFEIYSGHDAIRLAVTKGTGIALEGAADGSFVFVPGDKTTPDKWMSTFEVKGLDDTYYLYGYMPSVGNFTPVSENFANGATLNITGLPTATSSDVCVIVGVKKGEETEENSGIYSDKGIKMGSYSYDFTGETNHVYLLCDHLYAALQLKVKVNETYNALRHIKLKKVWVKDCKNGDNAPFTSKTNVEIELAKTTGASPIQNITFTNVGSSETNMEQSPLYNNTKGLLLTTSYQPLQGYMAPLGMTEFTLVSQYDVYDTNVTTDHPDGNLIRENQTAENKINVNSLFTTTISLQRGTRYILYLTVNPTYLYMMSEPDLDNPTIEVGS